MAFELARAYIQIDTLGVDAALSAIGTITGKVTALDEAADDPQAAAADRREQEQSAGEIEDLRKLDPTQASAGPDLTSLLAAQETANEYLLRIAVAIEAQRNTQPIY